MMTTSPLRILFAGMFGDFSRLPLARLLAAGADVVGVVVPAREKLAGGVALRPLSPPPTLSSLPLLTPHVEQSVVQLAWGHGIPVWEVARLGDTAVAETFAALQPDVALVACFSKMIPPSLLSLPRFGWLNLHPSRLPHFRGPEPLFWTLRAGLRDTAVTLHWLDAGMDSGDIALQRAVTLPGGSSGAALDRLLAQVGGEMLLDALGHLANGTLPRQPQPDGGSYQPSPQAADFALDVGWSARRAFDFMRGTAEWGMAYRVAAWDVWLETAVAMDEDAVLAQPVVMEKGLIGVQFAPGVVWAKRWMGA